MLADNNQKVESGILDGSPMLLVIEVEAQGVPKWAYLYGVFFSSPCSNGSGEKGRLKVL
jgi:hypothetical protein